MTVAIANVNINLHNFDYWIARTNEVILAMNTVVLSSNSITSGNSGITGIFQANAYIGNTGNVVTLTSNSITSNVLVATTSTITTGNVVTLTSNNATITTGNVVTLTSNNATITTGNISTLAGGASTGNGASGTWGINITGASAKVNNGSFQMIFNWSGQPGQPTWVWGGSDGANMYVYNPSAFNVNNATYVNGYNVNQDLRTTDKPVFNGVSIQNSFILDYITSSITSTSLTVIDSWPTTTYRSAEYILDIKDNIANNIVHTRIGILQNGGTVFSTEYETLISNNQIGILVASSNATHVLLTYQSAVSTSISIKGKRELITV